MTWDQDKTIGIRVVMALLLFAVAVAPACMMAMVPSQAMAADTVVSSDCGSSDGTTLAPDCTDSSRETVLQAKQDTYDGVFVPAIVALSPADTSDAAPAASLMVPRAPVSHLTPLRL